MLEKRGRRRGKKGQFYIIAAIIIIAVIVGFAAIRNYAQTGKKRTKIYDLGEELKIETGNVYDYGVYNGTDIDNLIENWAEIYSEYTESQEIIEDWFFVYGNEEEMSAVTFTTTEAGEIGIYTGMGRVGVQIQRGRVNRTIIGSIHGGRVNVTFQNFTYDFELEEGENFFFVIRGGEYSATG